PRRAAARGGASRTGASERGASAAAAGAAQGEVFDPALFDTCVELWAVRLPAAGVGRLLRAPEFEQLVYTPRKKQRRRSGTGARLVRNVVQEGPSQDGGGPASALLLLRPGLGPSELPPEAAALVAEARGELVPHSLRLGYEGVGYRDALRRLLPAGVAPPCSYEVVGHVAHFNLLDEQMPHRHVIGQVLLDKVRSVETVVTKVGQLSGEFRTFDMEVVAGREDTRVSLRESGLTLEFDFRLLPCVLEHAPGQGAARRAGPGGARGRRARPLRRRRGPCPAVCAEGLPRLRERPEPRRRGRHPAQREPTERGGAGGRLLGGRPGGAPGAAQRARAAPARGRSAASAAGAPGDEPPRGGVLRPLLLLRPRGGGRPRGARGGAGRGAGGPAPAGGAGRGAGEADVLCGVLVHRGEPVWVCAARG
ncbi:unnamed protein product, partial [Prorocentrum cordatum]